MMYIYSLSIERKFKMSISQGAEGSLVLSGTLCLSEPSSDLFSQPTPDLLSKAISVILK